MARISQQVNPELEAKTNLLKSDPALYQLYNDLVVGKLITAEEFWANRFGNGSVKGQPLKTGEEQQEIGLPSAFLVRQAKQVFPDHVECLTPNFQSQDSMAEMFCNLVAPRVVEKTMMFQSVLFVQADVQVQFDGCNKAKYNITMDAIEAIFKTYPSGKRFIELTLIYNDVHVQWGLVIISDTIKTNFQIYSVNTRLTHHHHM